MVALRWVCVAAWMVAVAAGCERPTSRQAQSGMVASPDRLEFGPSAMGVPKVMKLRVSNQGRAPFTVHGATSNLPNVVVPPFEAFELGAGAERELEVRFTPDVEGAVQGVLELLTDADNGRQEGVGRVGVAGRGVRAWVEVRTGAIDFGNVELGSVKVRELVVRNPTDVESRMRLDLEGADVDQFSSSAAGDSLTLQPGEERVLPLAFNPARLGSAQAVARVVVCEGCEPAFVPLAGTGIAALLEVTPLRVNFGRVVVGATAEERITVRNLGTEPMAYGGVRLLDDVGGTYRLMSAPVLPGNVLAPGAAIEVRVAFSPTATGPAREGRVELDVRRSGSSGPGPKVALVGEGGNSCVSVQPRTLDFGVVAEGMSATRQVEVFNRCRAEVLLREVQLTTRSGGYFMLEQAPASLPIPAGQSVQVGVGFRPRASGPGEAQLTLKLLTGHSTSTEVVAVKGEGRAFSPCQYELVPSSLDFGRVPVGSEVTLGVAVRNAGASPCYLAGMQLAGGSDAAFSADPVGSSVLDPGQRALLRVRFKPGAEGGFEGLAEAWVNHPTQGHPVIFLRGVGVQGCFSVQPTTVEFGTTRLACGPRTRELMIYNRCSGPVTLQGIALEGDAGEFTVSHGLSFPRVLPAGSQHRVQVVYQPQNDGEDVVALRFELAGGERYTAGLVGLGVSKTEQTDRFIQQSQAKVDVLFVVDNSGSMMDEQQSLGQNFAAFLGHADAAGVDYQIAVTTTGIDPSPGGWAVCPGGADGGEAGRFFPIDNSSPRVITPTTPNASAVFAYNTQVGVCHWNEQGLDAVYRALSPPLLYSADDPRTPAPADGNGNFVRPDAKLAIIFVSDEEDFSAQQVPYYETFLLALKDNDPSKLSVSAIVGPEDLSTCPKSSSSGRRYMQLARNTGGVVESICTPNWAASLEKLSESAFGLNRAFPLSEKPADPSRIVVKVDGVVVTSGWVYDPRSNAIVFDADAAPLPGSVIEVTYPVGC